VIPAARALEALEHACVPAREPVEELVDPSARQRRGDEALHDDLLELKRESLRIVEAHDINRTLDTFEALYRGEEVVDPVDDGADAVAP
jgi:hypothetical protein